MTELTLSPRAAAYRAQLLAQNGGNESLADMSVEHELRKGEALQARHAELRKELADVDLAIVAHNAETRRRLAPLEAEAERLAAAAARVTAALDATRTARQSDLMVGSLGKRRAAILAELQTPHSPAFKVAPWHEHREGEPNIAPMTFPDGN